MTQLLCTARIIAPMTVLACVGGAATAQRSPATSILERYTRAAAIQAHRRDHWILNNSVVPHWIVGTDQVWYRRETATGSRYVQVDARTGTKSDLFDHPRLAELLGRETGKSIDPNRLSYFYGGLSQKLVGVEHTEPIRQII